MQPSQDQPKLPGMSSLNSSLVAGEKEAFQALVGETSDHSLKCNPIRVRLQLPLLLMIVPFFLDRLSGSAQLADSVRESGYREAASRGGALRETRVRKLGGNLSERGKSAGIESSEQLQHGLHI